MVDAKVRGAFILFEGIDRCGKSTQARCLLDALRSQGLQVEIINFPNRTTPIGKIINEYLIGNTDINGQALHLMFSANRWEMKEYIESRLASGTSLIVDRYVYSGIAFSVAKVLHFVYYNFPKTRLGLDIEWCKASDIVCLT
ncbi:hypothetical protein BVRB_030150 [Beta vulgaris subsp. vulgaris]|uniref:dTMP kinase n=1 Tax=Beta vulgaris subsp. vulgaris TaxID=3555 RepID=A0A0J8AXM6_BETVV|nr:hypothetical protein BVRB_030150 [Beta vulgaris subsp. vulgaris]